MAMTAPMKAPVIMTTGMERVPISNIWTKELLAGEASRAAHEPKKDGAHEADVIPDGVEPEGDVAANFLDEIHVQHPHAANRFLAL